MPGGATRARVAADWLLDRFIARNIVQIAPTRPAGIRRQRFRGGDVVYDAGDPAGPLFIIAEGRFARGEEMLGRGEFFGGEFLRSDPQREVGVRAVEDGACLVLQPQELEQLALCLDSLAPFLKGGPAALRRAGAE
jgi:CRP-like cAMP-binding protein